MKKLSSRTQFKIKSLNQERKLGELAKKITLYKIDRLDKAITSFEVDSKYGKEVSRFLKSEGVEILETNQHGLKNILTKLMTSYGIIVAGLLLLVCYLIQYNYVWKIDIFGLEKLNRAEVVAFIDSNVTNRWKGSIDTKELEIKMKENFDRVSSVSVAIVGQSLVVSINESILPDEMLGEFSPIKSNFDGKVTKINLIQGSLAVKVGDIVKAGDILVYPYIIDTDGEKRDVKPRADIEADVWYEGEVSHYESYQKVNRTGNKVEICEISLYGLILYSNNKEMKFTDYEFEESVEYFSKNNILPLKISRKKYFEIEYLTINQNFEEVREEKLAEARQNALIYLQESEIIKEENYIIKSTGGITTVSYILTVQKNIGG